MRLRDLRLEKKLLQKEIAGLLGVDRTTYSKYESEASEPNWDTVIRLAKIFGVSTDYLLGVTDRRGTPPTSSDEELSATQNEAVQFIKGLSDDQLVRFINMGRAAFEMGGSQQTQNAPRREAGG